MFEIRDFLLDLGFELVGGAAKLIQRFAHLASDLRQLLGPKDDERQKEQENRFPKAHAPIILPQPWKRQCRGAK